MSGPAAMQRFAMSLPFKGSRTYLQGPSLVDGLAAVIRQALPEWAGCSGAITFHRFAGRECDVLIAAAGDTATPDDAVADFRFERGDGGELSGWLVETQREVTQRIPYPEEAICAAATIAERSTSLAEDQGFSAMETAVSLTKHQHNRLFPVPGKRWIFTKLEFSRLPEARDIPGMTIVQEANLGNRITKSAFMAGGERIATIFFSAVNA